MHVCLVEHKGVVVEGEKVAGVGATLDWFALALNPAEKEGKGLGRKRERGSTY